VVAVSLVCNKYISDRNYDTINTIMYQSIYKRYEYHNSLSFDDHSVDHRYVLAPMDIISYLDVDIAPGLECVKVSII
jgi:hypothetical protein